MKVDPTAMDEAAVLADLLVYQLRKCLPNDVRHFRLESNVWLKNG